VVYAYNGILLNLYKEENFATWIMWTSIAWMNLEDTRLTYNKPVRQR
jgi:hypothetical protein